MIIMETLILTLAWFGICAGAFLAWTYTKSGKKWLKGL